jgi:hypothetical protein
VSVNVRDVLTGVAVALSIVSLFFVPPATMWSGWVGGTSLGIAVTLIATHRSPRRADR